MRFKNFNCFTIPNCGGTRTHNTDSTKKLEDKIKKINTTNNDSIDECYLEELYKKDELADLMRKKTEEEKQKRRLSKTYRYYPQLYSTNNEDELNKFLQRNDIYNVNIDYKYRDTSNDILFIVYYELREEIITEV